MHPMIPSLFKFFNLILDFTGDHIYTITAITIHNVVLSLALFQFSLTYFAFVVSLIFLSAANSPLLLVPFAFFLLKFMTVDCAIPRKNLHSQAETQHRFFAWGVNWQDASWLWSGIWCGALHKQIHLANTWITPNFPFKALSPALQ